MCCRSSTGPSPRTAWSHIAMARSSRPLCVPGEPRPGSRDSPAAAAAASASAPSQSMREWLGESRLKEFINFTLVYLATLDIPIKR